MVNEHSDERTVDRKIWMQLDVGNNVRSFDVSNIYNTLGEEMCSALAGFHAFIGCDFNPAIFRKVKKRPFTILQKEFEFRNAFSAVGDPKILVDSHKFKTVTETIEKFVCSMHSLKSVHSVNEARIATFNKT